LWLDDFKLERFKAEGSRLKAESDPEISLGHRLTQINTD
jgi:hypothetical protein